VIGELTLTIDDHTGPQGTVSVGIDELPRYRYAVTDQDERSLVYGEDLKVGASANPNHVKAACSLLAFLESDAEKYRTAMSAGDTSEEAVERRTGDHYCFNERTAEWAYRLADELAMARLELDPDA
jgi:hypothetical protein